MTQALHIFRKDVRYLWREILIVLTATSAFTIAEIHSPAAFGFNQGLDAASWDLVEFLLPLTWWMLVARVIHAESLVSDREFWMTRPYSRMSLLLAKLLFVLAFINLPLLVADTIVVVSSGFPIRAAVAGLLWRQVVVTAAVILPIAAVSALTAGLVQLLVATLIGGAALVVWAVTLPATVMGEFWGPMEWVKDYYVLSTIAAFALGVILWQYASRRTGIGWAVAVVAAVVASGGPLVLPWKAGFGVQSLFAGGLSAASIHVELSPTGQVQSGGSAGKPMLFVPLRIVGVPAGMAAKAEAVEVNGAVEQQGTNAGFGEFLVPVLADAVRGGRMSIRGTAFLTVFGNRAATSIDGAGPIYIPDVGLCTRSAASPRGLLFTALFRFHPCFARVEFIDRKEDPSHQPFFVGNSDVGSYSPFAADISLSPTRSYFVFLRSEQADKKAYVTTLKPVAHIRREFDVVVPAETQAKSSVSESEKPGRTVSSVRFSGSSIAMWLPSGPPTHPILMWSVL